MATAEARRAARLHNVTEALRLYEQLQRALGQTADADLERLAAASRAGERALGTWGRRIEAMRVLKRRFESGSIARGPLFTAAPARGERSRRTTSLAAVGEIVRGGWTLDEPRSLPFLWEAVAFALGLAVSLLLS